MGVVHRRKVEGDSWKWEGVETEAYTSGATRQVLIGPEDGSANFAVRYFTLPIGGLSNLDYHEHDHGVVVVRGKARLLLGSRYEEIAEGDAIYIPGWERHQFENIGEEPFTFFCVIPPKAAKVDTCVLPAVMIKPEPATAAVTSAEEK